MRFTRAFVPAGGIWSSPFARWQGSLAAVNSLDLAAAVTTNALAERRIEPGSLSKVILGQTVPQEGTFYGPSLVAARIGAPGIAGLLIVQACATSAACLEAAAGAVELGATSDTHSVNDAMILVATADRLSNSPLLVYPRPDGPGGAPRTEHWVLASFERDPWAGVGPLQTAEAVAAEMGIERAEVDDVTLLRYEQYARAIADDRAFQRRYFIPIEVDRGRRQPPLVIDADEGVASTSAEALARLKPVIDDGRITFGTQTHPADGAAGAVVTTEARARELSRGSGIVQIVSSGTSRVEKGRMPKASVPAARQALDHAGIGVADLSAVTTHNPFAVNDIYFARETGVPLERTNEYGCSLVWGHPQGPTGLRAIAELVETLRLRGGGYGLFTGCAAGDTGAAIVVKVTD
jgi:acetyl-CoA acetyltransferase